MNARTRTNLTLDANLVARAKAEGINVSRAAEEGLSRAVRAAERARWMAENRAAMESNKDWIDKNGIPLSEYRMF
ncbi:MAG: type II toxin-antitoxin system CcdA family antitoxin [Pseudomonadota bacterium]